ncbi:MAG: hypothetical protein ACLQIQ_18650 [Beijerinckiaceae bacterium]
MRGNARRNEPPFGKANAEEASVVSPQLKISAPEYFPQGLRRHSDFATAGHFAAFREEPVKVIVGTGERLIPACQNAGTAKSTKIMHIRFPSSERHRCLGPAAKKKKPRNLDEVRGQHGAQRLFGQQAGRILRFKPPVHPWSTFEIVAVSPEP